MGRFLGLIIAAATVLGAGTACAMPLRSDVPFWGETDRDAWPHGFHGDLELGCASRLPFGIWKRSVTDDPEDVVWLRIHNYGVFHCAAMVAVAPDNEPKDWAPAEPSYLVELGEARGANGKLQLFALQAGYRTGADLVLLAAPEGSGRLTRFIMLDVDCPKAWVREARTPSVWTSEYCAVPSKAGLVRLAKAAARRPPAGQLELTTEAGGQGDEKP